MSFPRYEAYRESGREWFGLIPQHWGMLPLKHIVDPDRAVTYGIVQAREHVPDGVPYIRPADMTDEKGVADRDAILRTSEEIAEAYARSTIRTGDIVCSIGPSFGKVMVTPEWLDGANLTQGTARIAVASSNEPRYVFWALRSQNAVAQWESAVGGATFRALNLGPLAATLLPVPPPAEQRAVAAFLDREIHKLDALVAEQQRLIALLAEKRQAVISHAVTKGLNPEAAMKASGVEWMGDVPAHWRVLAIKRLSRIQRGASPRPIDEPQYFDDDGEYAWVRISDVSASDGTLRETTQRLSELGSSLSVKLEPGSLFVSIAGTVGKPCISAIRACIHDGFVFFPDLPLDPRFLYRIFEAGTCFAGLGKLGTQLNLNTDTIGAIKIAVPPAGEMAEIVNTISERLTDLEVLSCEAQMAVRLLEERRGALISAAVTGQIDVRGLVDAETPEAAAEAVAA